MKFANELLIANFPLFSLFNTPWSKAKFHNCQCSIVHSLIKTRFWHWVPTWKSINSFQWHIYFLWPSIPTNVYLRQVHYLLLNYFIYTANVASLTGSSSRVNGSSPHPLCFCRASFLTVTQVFQYRKFQQGFCNLVNFQTPFIGIECYSLMKHVIVPVYVSINIKDLSNIWDYVVGNACFHKSICYLLILFFYCQNTYIYLFS